MKPRIPVLSLFLTAVIALFAPAAPAQSNSVFKYAVFYQGLLEFSDCATMTVNGRVHCNSNIYVGTTASLTFSSNVTCVGTFTAPDNNGRNFATNPIIYNAADWGVYFVTNSYYTTNSSFMNLGIPSTNSHFIIDIPPASENPTGTSGAYRLYNQAQTLLIVSNTALWLKLQASPTPGTLPAGDSNPITLTYTNFSTIASNLPFLTLTNKFYDGREGRTNLVAQIDVGTYSSWLLTNNNVLSKFAGGGSVTNYPTILFVADTRASNGLLTVVRLTNGLALPKNGGLGWTIATPNPLYVWGNYNCTNNAYLGTTNTSATVPAALLSDALTILSSNWKDTNSLLGGTYSSSSSKWDAAGTNTINAAILTGNVPSTGTTTTSFSGGVQNLPRLLEDWSSSTFWLNTSIVCLYNSTKATNQWKYQGTYYNPPTRKWAFDPNLSDPNKFPPGSPMFPGPPPNPATIIVSQPQSTNVFVGSNVTFRVTVSSGHQPVYYQWFFNRTNLITTSFTNFLTLTSVQPKQAGLYSVRISDSVGFTTNSAQAQLTVRDNLKLKLPATVNENAGVLANAGSVSIITPLAADLVVTLYTNSPNRLIVPNSVTIPAGQTNATFDLTIVNDAVSDGSHQAFISANADTYFLVSTSLTVLDDDVDHLSLTAINSSQALQFPFSVTITAQDGLNQVLPAIQGPVTLTVTDDAGPVLFSPTDPVNFVNGTWTGNVTILQFATNAVLTADDGLGHVVASNPFQVNAGDPPVIVSQPTDLIVMPGSAATFSATATGTALNFQWLFNGDPIAGATQSSLTFANAKANQSGVYALLVTNVLGAALSSNATLSFNCYASDLTAWWRAEGDAGDAIGSYDGSPVNVSFAPGMVGQGFQFNGTNAAIRIPSTAGLSTTNYTVQAWIKPTAQPKNQENQSIVVGQSYGFFQLVIRNGTTGVYAALQIKASNGTFYWASSTHQLPLNTFSHIAGTWDGNTLCIYINGVLEGQANPGRAAVDSGCAFFIGGFNEPGNSTCSFVGQYFQGQIDEAGFYNRTLTSNEINSLYAAGSVGICTAIAPAFLTQPASQTVNATSNVTFSVTANGTIPLSYQWQFNGTDIVDATNASFTLFNVSTNDTGAYSVILTNSAGSLASSNAMLTVLVPLPVITSQPANLTVKAAADATFTVGASGVGPLAYQWQFNHSDIADATNSSLTLTHVGIDQAGIYSATVSNSAGSTNSSDATLIVVVDPPVLTSQPTDLNVSVGSSPTFAVTTTGTAPLYFQWQMNGATIADATNASLTLNNVQLTDVGVYSVTVTNLAGSTTSSNATLSVYVTCTAAPTGLVSWWRAEGNSLDEIGDNDGALLNGVNFAPGMVGQAFQFSGANTAIQIPHPTTLSISNYSLEAWIKPTAQVTNGDNQCVVMAQTSGFGQLLIKKGSTGVFAAIQFKGANGNFSTITSPGELPLNQFTHLLGTWNGATLNLYTNGFLAGQLTPGTQPVDSGCSLYIGGFYEPSGNCATLGQYFIGLIDEASLYNRALSAGDALALYRADALGKCVPQIAPVITTQPTNYTTLAGYDAAFTVTATGTPLLSFQWQFNGTNIMGATNTTLTLVNVQAANAGNYNVIVSNAIDTISSSNAVLTVLPLPTCTTAPTGLVAWWRAEGNAQDEVGGNDGALLNGLGFVTGKVGQAFDFDGVDDAVQIAHPASLTITNYSLEAWIKPTAQINNGDNQSVVIAQTRGFGQLIIKKGTTGVYGSLQFKAGNGAFYGVTSPGQLPLNQFTHLLGTWDGGTLKLYINGVLASQTTPGIGPLDSGCSLYIGGFSEPTGVCSSLGQYFTGLIDEVSLYNRALTASEALTLYQADAGGKCAPAAPTILVPPVDAWSYVDGGVTLSCSAIGSRTLAYQWALNNSPIDGATNTLLALTHLTLEQAGVYSVTVSNGGGSATGSANVAVYPQYAAIMTGTTFSSATGFGLSVTGKAGIYYTIEASTNLIDWNSIFTNLAPFQFVDPDATNYPMRFYRANQVP